MCWYHLLLWSSSKWMVFSQPLDAPPTDMLATALPWPSTILSVKHSICHGRIPCAHGQCQFFMPCALAMLQRSSHGNWRRMCMSNAQVYHKQWEQAATLWIWVWWHLAWEVDIYYSGSRRPLLNGPILRSYTAIEIKRWGHCEDESHHKSHVQVA